MFIILGKNFVIFERVNINAINMASEILQIIL